MRYFIKLTDEDGSDAYINPDQVQAMFARYAHINGKIDHNHLISWEIFFLERPTTESLVFKGDITPLLEAMRQEQIIYSVPIEALIKPNT